MEQSNINYDLKFRWQYHYQFHTLTKTVPIIVTYVFFVSDKLFGFEMAPGAFSRFLGSNSAYILIFRKQFLWDPPRGAASPTTRGASHRSIINCNEGPKYQRNSKWIFCSKYCPLNILPQKFVFSRHFLGQTMCSKRKSHHFQANCGVVEQKD